MADRDFSSMERFTPLLRSYLPYWLGGLFFWAPAVSIHAFRGSQFGASAADIFLITVLPLLSTGLGMIWLASRPTSAPDLGWACCAALLGIWMWGPFCMTLSATFSGAGFTSMEGVSLAIAGTLLFPPFAFMLSAYDGTLGALLIASVILAGVASISGLVALGRYLLSTDHGENL